MRRLAICLLTSVVMLALVAPTASAQQSGEGTYGPADDVTVTNAGFLVIAFFPLFILAVSLLQRRLEKRKDARKAAAKAQARATGDLSRGGW